ncbi:hypothetical protein HWV62_22684 [Athelia sp. TMB]|nr:hypothetical protein HWV62_22684 [Athelia sp. TMB]
MQGTLQIILRNSLSGQPIDDNELRRRFQQFGDVKSIVPMDNRPEYVFCHFFRYSVLMFAGSQRYLEYYDIRACDQAFDRLRHQTLQDGVMDISFAWDNTAESAAPTNQRLASLYLDANDVRLRQSPDVMTEAKKAPVIGKSEGVGEEVDEEEVAVAVDEVMKTLVMIVEMSGTVTAVGPATMMTMVVVEDEEAEEGPVVVEVVAGVVAMAAAMKASGMTIEVDPATTERHHKMRRHPQWDMAGALHTRPVAMEHLPHRLPQQLPSVTQFLLGILRTHLFPRQPVDQRVEQARKVQQLLAALKQPQTSGSPAPPVAAPPANAYPPNAPSAPPATNGYYPPPPGPQQRPPFPGSLPPTNTNSYPNMPASSTAPLPAQAQASLASLPPNILALLQQSQAQPQPPVAAQYPGQVPPPAAAGAPAANYNQLMAFLHADLSNTFMYISFFVT